MSDISAETRAFTDTTKIGEIAAQQPLSGVGMVIQTGAVNGYGGFVRTVAPETKPETTAA